MSETLQNIGTFLSGPSGKGLEALAGIGATGAGLYSNINAEQQRAAEEKYLQQQQNALANPTVLANEVASATQPLSRGLTEALTNQVQGTLAESGLSESPGALATGITQAEAPFVQANQQQALQLVMQRLNLPLSYAQTLFAGLPPNTNLAPLLAMLSKTGAPANPNSTAGASTPSVTQLLNLINPGTSSGITTGTPSGDYGWLGDTSISDPNAGAFA